MAGTPVTIHLGGWGGSGDDSAIEQLVKLLNELVDDLETFRAAMATANGAAVAIADLTARRVQLIEQVLQSIGTGTPDTTPASIVVTAGDAQSAAPATLVTTPLKVTVKNAAATALAGVIVEWSSTDPETTLPGIQSITNASGEATLPYTTGTAVGAYVVTATVRGTALSTTFGVTTVAGTAATMTANSVQDQSAATSATVAAPPSVFIADEYDNPVAGTTVTFAVTAGSGSRDPATVDSGADGIATLTSWTLGASAGLNTLTATAAGLTNSPITFNANAVASAPTQIAIQSGGAQTGVTAGAAATATVARVKDVSNNAVEGVTVTATVTTGSGTFDAGTAVTNASGDASFTYTTHTTAETATLTFGFDEGAVTTTTTIASVAGTATKLVIATQPASNGNSGEALPGQPIIHVTDANGNVATGATNSIAAAIGTGNATISAGTPKAAVAGVATFTALTLGDTDGGANTIVFSTAGLTSATSTGVTLAPPVPVALQFVTQPSNVTEDVAGLSCGVWIVDENNVVVPGGNNAITVALTTPGGATLTGTLTVNATSGVANFSGLTVDTVGTYTLTATASGLTSAVSTSFTVSAASGTNEPAGMTQLTLRQFNAKPAASPATGNPAVEDGWIDRGDANSTCPHTDATSPGSPSNVQRCRFPINYAAGGGPVKLEKFWAGNFKNTVYVSYWIKIDSAMYGTSKLGYVRCGTSTSNYRDSIYLKTGSIDGETRNGFQVACFVQGGGVFGNGTAGIYPAALYAYDQWHRIELLLTVNPTDGATDGSCQLWVNGTQRVNTGLKVRGTGTLIPATSKWVGVNFNPTYDHTSPIDTPNQNLWYIYLDDYYASGKD